MNYIVILSTVFLMFYSLYVFHETFQEHYHSDMNCLTKYCMSGLLFGLTLILMPEKFYPCLFVGVLIIFPVFMYYKEEGRSGQLLMYFGVLAGSILLLTCLRYILSIIPSLMIPFTLTVDNLGCNLFIISMLFYLQRKLKLYQVPYTIIILLTFFMISVLDILVLKNSMLPNDHLIFLLPNGLSLSALGIFRMFYSMETSKDNVLNLTIQRYANKENKEKYEILEKENQLIMQQMHDMKKHLHMLENMENHNEEFATYKKEIEDKAEEILNYKIVNNTLIDRILQTYRTRLYRADIQCNVEVDDIDLSFMDIIDTTALLANLLDNAIESCEKCKERVLLLKIKKQSDFVMFKTKNSCNRIIEESGQLKTTKQDKLYHGYGIQNMRLIAHKYNGELNYRFDEEHHLFITSITLLINRS